MILIVSTASDEHAEAVAAELDQLRTPFLLLDLSQFPQEMAVALRYAGAGRRFSLDLPGRGELPLADCGAIWWRRPQSFRLHPEIRREAHRGFAFAESYETFAGLWLTTDAFWINPPANDEAAGHKVYQLRVAQEVGLAIPETLITNDPARARAFVNERGPERTVYKAFTATELDWRETRVLRRDEVELLDNVRYAPVIFQQYIEASVDLRITVVGDALFPAAIHSQETSYKVDFRIDWARTRVEPYRLPPEVEAGLRAFMRRLGLVYGAIDMRLTPGGEHVFLEINPSGQWLFIEARTGQPITATLARLLAAHGGGGSVLP